MSTNFLQCRRAATFPHRKPKHYCIGPNASLSATLLRRQNSTSTQPSRSGGQNPGKRLEELFPELFSPKPRHKGLNLSPENPRNGFPSDLSCLRPPVLEYVEDPTPGPDGSIPIAQRLKYWQRLAKTHYRFYKEGVIKVWHNQKERRKILQRLGPTWGKPQLLHVCAMLGREREPKDGAPPKLTRKEYHLCLRTRSDIHRLIPFSVVLVIFGEWTPLVIPLAFIPETCHRPKDQIKIVSRWCKRSEHFISKFDDKIDHAVADKSDKDPAPWAQTLFYRYLLWGYTANATFSIKLLPYIPIKWSAWLASRGQTFIPRHNEILADTVMIMREGGFRKLSAEDIVEYCMKCGSTQFLAQARLALSNGVHPANEAMRKHMVPILEAHARRMLDVDWTRLDPGFWWLQERHVRSGGDPSAPDAWAIEPIKKQHPA
ncbi:hypothetical protein A1O1_02982 [Capronia coronata CBS 617.96]|uniref:Letm1 RBD domain-containing protein n=1 Tax=Capronia coronata CBS 617.96 TaxID=1182541 RepID=W9YZ68_9EURO|nr:uncharacterized protein A1O1_02982 [Capronia coronata CBS 617.96]EXJ94586.1 hypothetical protein A1O1_02982 [Capronia coronata CBS 617.96]